MFHIWIIGEVREHALPHTLLTPAGEAFVDTIPVAILTGEEAPLGSRAINPQHGFEEATAGGIISNIDMGVTPKKCPQFGPVVVRQMYRCHTCPLKTSRQSDTIPSW